MTPTLYVKFEGTLVGTLTRDEDGVYTFAYASDWLATDGVFPLSLVLPVREEPHRGRNVAAFFDNLLPEGEARRRVERLAGIPEGNDLAFLEHFGQDCAGAFEITPKKDPSRTAMSSEPIEVTEQALAKVIEEGEALHSAIGLSNDDLPRFSLAGAQAKFACTIEHGKIHLPRQGEPSTHIVKLPIQSGKKLLDSVHNEFLCLQLAALVGFAVPPTFLTGGKHPVLVVARFDRDEVDGAVRRLHAQDFCQALGVPSQEKYETHGGPGAAACYQLLKGNAANVAAALLSFTDWIAFNLAVGNNDSHAKNLSLVSLRTGDLELAPFYDIVSTTLYPQYSQLFAFKLGSTNAWAKVRKPDLEGLAKQFGVKEPFLRARWLATFDRIEDALPKVARLEISAATKKTYKKICDETQKRIAHLRTHLQARE